MTSLPSRVAGELCGLLERAFAQEDEADGALTADIRAVALRLAALECGPELASWCDMVQSWTDFQGAMRRAEVARGLRLLRNEFGRQARAAAAPRSDDDGLAAPTQSLPGIGPALSGRLAEHGVDTVEDLIWLVPRRYDDARATVELAEVAQLEPVGERVTVRGEVFSSRFNRRGRRRWVDVRLRDGDAQLVVRWFGGHPSLANKFRAGSKCVFAAVLRARGGALEMANPDVLEIISPEGEVERRSERIIARYRDLQGVPPATLRKAIRAAVERAADLVESAVPPPLELELRLPSLSESLAVLHNPPEGMDPDSVVALNEQSTSWHERLAFEELFVLGAMVARRRQQHRADRAPSCPGREDDAELVRSALPFSMTAAQQRVTETIWKDLAADVPMNRLLQGDVGSGKTAVAFAAAVRAAMSGRQVAVMAPTELLAEQHLRSLEPWLRECGLSIALLTASTPRAVRSSTVALLAAGDIDVIVGTHALLSDEVVFSDLGLAIVDEQHRFGVAQRVKLRERRRSGTPHLLVMTATPIPRTLAMSAYGDLDVSVLDELPPGRVPASTELHSGRSGRARVYRELRSALAEGTRAYLVCPMVAPGEDTVAHLVDAETAAAALASKWPEVEVELIHGRMSRDDRDRAMSRFRSGAAQLLVSTTVIEVGVDVPEARVMVIEDADRFGLSQLHQLRGRIGRGGGASRCLLVTRGGKTTDGARRLEVMTETHDGFVIAEADLEIRGPGELLGTRQAGLPKLRFGDLLRHANLLQAARDHAILVLEEDPELRAPEHIPLRTVLERRAAEDVYGAESG